MSAHQEPGGIARAGIASPLDPLFRIKDPANGTLEEHATCLIVRNPGNRHVISANAFVHTTVQSSVAFMLLVVRVQSMARACTVSMVTEGVSISSQWPVSCVVLCGQIHKGKWL